MLRYAITNRTLYLGDEPKKQAALLQQAAKWIAEGIDFIQLREKDLPSATLMDLTRNMLKKIHLAASPTKLLINSRPDIALAANAHGVNLTSATYELTPNQVRSLFAAARQPIPIITASCHTLLDVQRACQNQVDAILFSPVFEKPLPDAPPLPGQGLDQLRIACTAAAIIPIYALGGVTPQNAPSCLAAGAAGIAGIRLFHHPHNDLLHS
jgi:thiamine-phosphate pyrophosphorylase